MVCVNVSYCANGNNYDHISDAPNVNNDDQVSNVACVNDDEPGAAICPSINHYLLVSVLLFCAKYGSGSFYSPVSLSICVWSPYPYIQYSY